MWKSILSGFIASISSLVGALWVALTYFDDQAFQAKSKYREELLLACIELSTVASSLMVTRDRDQLSLVADEFLKLYHGKVSFLTGASAAPNDLSEGVSFVWGLKNNIYFAKTREGYVDELNYGGLLGIAREMSKVPVFCKKTLQAEWAVNIGSSLPFNLSWLNTSKVGN